MLRLSSFKNRSWNIREIIRNSGALTASNMLQSILGLPYWWIAAHFFTPYEVGYATALVSAMILLATFSMFGWGTLLTGELSKGGHNPQLIATGLVFAGTVGVIAGVLFGWVAPRLIGIHSLSSNVLALGVFAAGVGLTSLTQVSDLAAVGLFQPKLQFWRNMIFAISKLALVFVVGFVAAFHSGPFLFATWVAGLAISTVWLLFVAKRRRVRWRDYRPRWSLVRSQRRAAIAHHSVNLLIQAPSLMLTLIATATISVSASAYVYTALLVTGFLTYGAFAITTALYAVGGRDKESLIHTLRFTMRWALILGLVANIVLLAGANLILDVFGHEYSKHAAILLRVFAFGLFMVIVKDHYIALCRIRDKLFRATVVCAIGSSLEIGFAALGAIEYGLAGLALGQLVAQTLEAIVMAPTIFREAKWRLPFSQVKTP